MKKHLCWLMIAWASVAGTSLVWAGATQAAPDDQNESLYQLNVQLTDHHGHTAGLDVFRGQPVLISMFYGRCPHVCPMIISTVKMTESALPPEQREQVRVLMVSLDPEHDTSEFLAEVAGQHRVDDTRWKLVHATPADVRKLAAVLGVRYRKLPDGEFNHTTSITLLDNNGVPVATSDQLMKVDDGVLTGVQKVVSGE